MYFYIHKAPKKMPDIEVTDDGDDVDDDDDKWSIACSVIKGIWNCVKCFW